jgi:hypothetical protein
VVALLGFLGGNKVGKSTGRKEGAEQASQQQQITQAKAVVEATQERVNVDQKVAATPRADIDRELSEFSRPD